jgi:hypothetical protein
MYKDLMKDAKGQKPFAGFWSGSAVLSVSMHSTVS